MPDNFKGSRCVWLPSHPLWLAGFRPFFLLAVIFAVIVPPLWGLVFSGFVTLPSSISALQWHAHEMLFGFGWAVLGGFLLTASKNWVKVRGIHGWPLMGLVVLWLVERFAIFLPADSGWLRIILLNLFEAATVTYILQTLLIHRKNDSYKDNAFFVFVLLSFLVAKNLLLQSATYGEGISLTVGLFRLAFTLMFERTMTQFMKNTENIELLKNRTLDLLIKLTVLIAAFESFFSSNVAGGWLVSAAVLLFIRWLLWKPWLGLRKFGNGVMYLGYLGLVLHLLFEGLQRMGIQFGVSTNSLHVFTFLCMGIVIPSMFVRIAQGHTGRRPEFHPSDKVAIAIMGVAATMRLVFPVLIPTAYSWWIVVAGLLWSCCFLIIGLRLGPFLLRPRIDGKVH